MIIGCDRAAELTFVNQTDIDLVIKWSEFKFPGVLNPGNSATHWVRLEDEWVKPVPTYHIRIEDVDGHEISNEFCTEEQFIDMEWTMIIRNTQEQICSDDRTGRTGS